MTVYLFSLLSSTLSSHPSITSFHFPNQPRTRRVYPIPHLKFSAASTPSGNSRSSIPPATSALKRAQPSNGWGRFGKTLQSCVILAFRNSSGSSSDNNGGGRALKVRVMWTISALIAASARHFMMADVVNEQRYLSNLIIFDKENEGTVIMYEDGLRELRESEGESVEEINDGGVWWRNNRTTVPSVGMRMRHEAKLELSSGTLMEGATLVVVRPVGGGAKRREVEEQYGDDVLAAEAFGKGGVYAEAVERLLKSRI